MTQWEKKEKHCSFVLSFQKWAHSKADLSWASVHDTGNLDAWTQKEEKPGAENISHCCHKEIFVGPFD